MVSESLAPVPQQKVGYANCWRELWTTDMSRDIEGITGHTVCYSLILSDGTTNKKRHGRVVRGQRTLRVLSELNQR